ncbi:hypothetical protein [Lysobacter sp. CA199]|uniref:hypothetical protein n=1 Tax=Lysobacter sp. CA199 TaxID=3455608 RepID=UPI003F8D7FC9
MPVCACGCAEPAGAAAHAIARALARDDLDGAISLGLLNDSFDHAVACAQCAPSCALALREAREQRLRALAARERYRARAQRLQRRADERAAQRAAPAPSPVAHTGLTNTNAAAPQRPALPNAAAAALARAKAKAAQRGPT